MSHGIERPPAGSRSAELVELCWALRLFLIEEINRSGKSPGESKILSDLNARAANVDKRIYEAGGDSARASTVDREALRPFALDVRNFAARHHPLVAWPIWSGARVPVATDTAFFSGSSSARKQLAEVCRELELDLMSTRKGENVASARWEQLQKANIAIFDLGAPAGPERAAVTYELGIAFTLGKPVVVLAPQDEELPFDIDVEPVPLTGTVEDSPAIRAAR